MTPGARACVRRGQRGTKVFLCVWHVKRAWVKNLRQKVRGKGGHFKEMLAQLTAILEATELPAAEELMRKFLESWVRGQSDKRSTQAPPRAARVLPQHAQHA